MKPLDLLRKIIDCGSSGSLLNKMYKLKNEPDSSSLNFLGWLNGNWVDL